VVSARVLVADVESRDPDGAAARSPPPSGAGESSFAPDRAKRMMTNLAQRARHTFRPSSSHTRRRERALIRPTSVALDQPLQRRGLIPPRQAWWSANGSLEDRELMAQREVLKRHGGGTGQEGAQEGPETDRENQRGSRPEA
jgi:hypothetical protein